MRAPRILRLLGPGLITGSSDADPTSVVSFAMVGSSLGTALLWVPFLLYPLLAAIQMMCARAAIVTGAGLASIMKSAASPSSFSSRRRSSSSGLRAIDGSRLTFPLLDAPSLGNAA